MPTVQKVSRRDFLKHTAFVAGSGFVLGTFIGCKDIPAQLAHAVPFEPAFSPNVFLSISNTGAVQIVASRSEMGQGIRTALPAVLADELEADWEQVTVTQGTGDAKYGDQNTDGSQSVRNFFFPMRQAGAAAREMLVAAAAQQWEVPADECAASDHMVTHTPTGRKKGYGELAETAATLPVPENPTLKSRDQFKYIGASLPIVDMDDILTGKAVYGIDAARPGMVYASMERSPVLGGRFTRYDRDAVLAKPGVMDVVEIDAAPNPPVFQPFGGLAVVADSTWNAMQGRKQLNVQWEDGNHASFSSDSYQTQLHHTARQTGNVIREHGDVNRAFREAAQTIEAEYYVPLLAHATMEPPACVAEVRDDGSCEVWAPVQDPQSTRQNIAGLLGIGQENITVNVTLLGGAFGRKSKPDFVLEAVAISKATGKPVKLTWTREDDIRHGFYHSVSAQYLRGALDASGKTTALLHRTVFPSISSTFAPNVTHASVGELGLGFWNNPFDLPHLCCENGAATAHVRIGWLRSVCNIFHSFAINGFAHELAAAAGRDPKDYLLELIGPARVANVFDNGKQNYGMDPAEYPFDTGRLRNVIEVAAQAGGWGSSKPEGRGLGIAAQYSFVTYVAQVIDASVDDDGKITIHRVDCAVDCGTIVNPDRVKSQMEGAIIFGLSLALYGNITAEDGRIIQSNFHDYPLLRMHEMPEIHIHLVESEALPTGIGEPGVPPVAPALTGALFAATGKRIRTLPVAV